MRAADWKQKKIQMEPPQPSGPGSVDWTKIDLLRSLGETSGSLFLTSWMTKCPAFESIKPRDTKLGPEET